MDLGRAALGRAGSAGVGVAGAEPADAGSDEAFDEALAPGAAGLDFGAAAAFGDAGFDGAGFDAGCVVRGGAFAGSGAAENPGRSGWGAAVSAGGVDDPAGLAADEGAAVPAVSGAAVFGSEVDRVGRLAIVLRPFRRRILGHALMNPQPDTWCCELDESEIVANAARTVWL